MTNIDMWLLVVGFLMPLMIAIIQQPGWSEPVRALVMALACILAAVGTNCFNGALGVPLAIWAEQILLITVTAIATYKGFWQPTGIAPAIEKNVLNIIADSPGRTAD